MYEFDGWIRRAFLKCCGLVVVFGVFGEYDVIDVC